MKLTPKAIRISGLMAGKIHGRAKSLSEASNAKRDTSNTDFLRHKQPEEGFISAACKKELRSYHSQCYSLRCTCDCHDRQR